MIVVSISNILVQNSTRSRWRRGMDPSPMSPFRRAVSEGSNRHRCVVQHHSLKSSHTFMALFGVIISHVLGFHKPPAGSYVSLHTYAPYVDTHILQKSRIKCRCMYWGFREVRRGIWGLQQQKKLHRHPHGGSTQSWSFRNTEEASFVVSVPSFLCKRQRLKSTVDVPFVYWNDDLKG